MTDDDHPIRLALFALHRYGRHNMTIDDLRWSKDEQRRKYKKDNWKDSESLQASYNELSWTEIN